MQNPKDVALMYAVGILTIFLIGVVGLATKSMFQAPEVLVALSFIYVFLGFAIPLGFYLYRNRCDMRSSAILSFLYGITIFPVYMIVFVIPMSMILSGGALPDFSALGRADWSGIAFELGFLGIVSMIVGVLVNLLITKYAKPGKK